MTAPVDIDRLRLCYANDGFCVTPPIFPDRLIKRAIAAAESVAAGESDTGLAPRHHQRERSEGEQRLTKIGEPHNASHVLRELFHEPCPWALAAAVVGARMLQVWAMDLLIKRPEPSTRANIGWHQDGPFAQNWNADGDLFTVWIALSDVDGASSPLRYLAGSQQLGLLEKCDLFHTDLTPAGAGEGLTGAFAGTEVAAVVPAGATALHHRHTLHASGPNLSTRPRISLAVRLRTERCTLVSTGDDVAHLDDPQLAPVVFDTRERP